MRKIEIPSFYSVLVPKGYSCPFCSEYVADDQTKLKQHILICGSPIKLMPTRTLGKSNQLASKDYGIRLISNSLSIDSACSSDGSDESNNEYCGYSSDEESELKKCRKITQSAWESAAFQKPNKLPHDIDGLCCFEIKDTNRIRLLEKVRDKVQVKRPNVECNFFCNTKSHTVFILQRMIPAKYAVPPPLDILVMPVNTLHSKEIKHIYSILLNTYVQQDRKQTLFLIMLKMY